MPRTPRVCLSRSVKWGLGLADGAFCVCLLAVTPLAVDDRLCLGPAALP